jgi:hypothetical protein
VVARISSSPEGDEPMRFDYRKGDLVTAAALFGLIYIVFF